MGKARNPRRGSMQFWPRKRSRHSFVRVRSWADEKKAKALGFVAYKAGMTHLQVVDNRPKSATKGEKVAIPVTIFDCPSMQAYGVAFYKNDAVGRTRKVGFVYASELSKELKKQLSRQHPIPKQQHSLDSFSKDFDYLRLLIASQPKQTSVGAKKPQLLELGVGGSKDEQLAYAKEVLGKELALGDVLAEGALVDVHAVTKGKGFQGVTKRYGVPLKSHKAEKGQRGIGNLGAWTPKRVDYRVAQPGKMGYHLRTEYNKQIIKIGENGEDVVPSSGLHQFGLIKNKYLLLKGSVAGPRKGAVLLTAAIRPKLKKATVFKGAPEIKFLAKR